MKFIKIDERFGKEVMQRIPVTKEEIIGRFKMSAAKWSKPAVEYRSECTMNA